MTRYTHPMDILSAIGLCIGLTLLLKAFSLAGRVTAR